MDSEATTTRLLQRSIHAVYEPDISKNIMDVHVSNGNEVNQNSLRQRCCTAASWCDPREAETYQNRNRRQTLQIQRQPDPLCCGFRCFSPLFQSVPLISRLFESPIGRPFSPDGRGWRMACQCWTACVQSTARGVRTSNRYKTSLRVPRFPVSSRFCLLP